MEHTVEGDGLVHIPLACRGGMGIDIVDIVEFEPCTFQGTRHRRHTTVVAGFRDTAAIAGEAIACHLRQNSRSTRHSVIVVLQHERCSTTAGYQSVTVSVEGAARLLRLIHAHGESSQCVKRCHRIVVGLLGTAAEHHVLQSLLYHHVAQSYRVTTTGAGGTDGEVHASQMEDGAQIHVHRRVHRLEDQAIAQHRRVMFLVHDLSRLDDGLCRRVIAEDAAYLMLTQVVVVHHGLFKGLSRGHIGILRLLRHACSCMTVQHLLRNNGRLHDTRQS